MNETESRLGDWPGFIQTNHPIVQQFLNKACKELYQLIFKLFFSNIDIKTEKAIIHIFFSCYLHNGKDYITADNVSDLLINVFGLGLKKDDISGPFGIFTRYPYHDKVEFQPFYSWYWSSKISEIISPSKLRIWFRKISGCRPNDYFLLYNYYINRNFIKQKSSLYDIVFQTHKFDILNPAKYKCPNCSYLCSDLKIISKHIVSCKNVDK